MKEEMDLVFDYPAKIASFLINDQVDIGLIPVAIIPDLAEYHIISDYCIGCNGEVASVCLFSEVPLHEIKTIVLDYQSKTSVALLKILLQEHWKISPKLVAGEKNYENSIVYFILHVLVKLYRNYSLSTKNYSLSLNGTTR